MQRSATFPPHTRKADFASTFKVGDEFCTELGRWSHARNDQVVERRSITTRSEQQPSGRSVVCEIAECDSKRLSHGLAVISHQSVYED